MKLILLGTGCPQVSVERYGPASLVSHRGMNFLVDCGAGATQRLLRAGIEAAAIDAIFLTDLHSAHVADLHQLIITAWHQGRDRPQRFFGPAGTRRVIDAVLADLHEERDWRMAPGRGFAPWGVEIESHEVAAGVVLEQNEMRVSAVARLPVGSAYGFNFAAAGRRLAFSGGTAHRAAVLEAAPTADVLVQEWVDHAEMAVRPGVLTEARAGRGALSAALGAATSQVGCLVLTHFAPGKLDKSTVLAEVRRHWRGSLVIGEDLLRVDLDDMTLAQADGLVGWAGAGAG